jgi:hypothetical protein
MSRSVLGSVRGGCQIAPASGTMLTDMMRIDEKSEQTTDADAMDGRLINK